MKLSSYQLESHLRKSLFPVYLLAGDEPLQMQECADLIRQTATEQGFTERQVMHVESGYDWSALENEAAAMSLFAERKLLDLRLPTGKPGRDGSAALTGYLERPPEDNLLLITSGKLDKSARNTAWFKAIDRAGGVLQVWDLNPAETLKFVGARLERAGFQPESEAVRLLTERVEGNLLAAVQEIEKLRLLRDPGCLSTDDVLAAVVDSSRYDPFELADAALLGDARRVVKIMEGLQGEDIAVNLILWALTRDVRVLSDFSSLQASGKNPQPALKSVWKNRQSMILRAAKRYQAEHWQQLLRFCALIDRTVKGLRQGNSWDELLQLALALAGRPALDVSVLLLPSELYLDS
ncbi:MAG: DNA polymerase III subunit delta [Thiotrichales bacterium]